MNNVLNELKLKLLDGKVISSASDHVFAHGYHLKEPYSIGKLLVRAQSKSSISDLLATSIQHANVNNYLLIITHSTEDELMMGIKLFDLHNLIKIKKVCLQFCNVYESNVRFLMEDPEFTKLSYLSDDIRTKGAEITACYRNMIVDSAVTGDIVLGKLTEVKGMMNKLIKRTQLDSMIEIRIAIEGIYNLMAS